VARVFGPFSISVGQSVRHWFSYGPGVGGLKIAFPAPFPFSTPSNRVVTVAQGIENGSDGLIYTVFTRCDSVPGGGGGCNYLLVVGGLT
jgi:hypothetical protein